MRLRKERNANRRGSRFVCPTAGNSGTSSSLWKAKTLSLIHICSYLLIGWDVLKAAFLGMMRGRAINENFLMSIASLGAMFLGDYSEAVGVMLFYRVGEYLQELSLIHILLEPLW